MNSLESFVKFIPSANNPSLTLTIPTTNILTDLESKSKRFISHLNDTLYEVSNEPSLGLYRIQEHVRKSIPKLSEKNDEMIAENSKIQGAIFDLDYSLEAIVKMVRSDTSFDAMNRLLLSSLNAAKQINAKNAKLAGANEPKKVAPRASSVPHSPRIPASASVFLTEQKPSPLTTSNTSSNQQISSTANNTPTPGFFSSLISNRMSRTSSVSENQNQPVRSSAQRSQTMSVSAEEPAEQVSAKATDLSTALSTDKLEEEPTDASNSENPAKSHETDLSTAEPPKEF